MAWQPDRTQVVQGCVSLAAIGAMIGFGMRRRPAAGQFFLTDFIDNIPRGHIMSGTPGVPMEAYDGFDPEPDVIPGDWDLVE